MIPLYLTPAEAALLVDTLDALVAQRAPGADDLECIELRLLARCVGHESWPLVRQQVRDAAEKWTAARAHQ